MQFMRFFSCIRNTEQINNRQHDLIFCCRAISLVIIFALFFALLPPVRAAAEEASDTNSAASFTWPGGPGIKADAAIVMEASTGLILYEKNIDTAYYPASITKVMTALLALENCSLSETVTMSENAEKKTYGSKVGLVEGEQVTLEDAMYAMLLDSANEVSYAIGEHVAAKVNSSKGSMEEFAELMNQKAAELGCVNSHFVNSHGLHEDDHYVCAYDMALIGRAAIAIPQFRTIAGSRTHVIPPTNLNVQRYLAHHHRFINTTTNIPHYDYTIAGKTGATTEAQSTLITFAEKNGMLLIAVVLHVDTALHAYEDTIKILNFAYDNYSLYSIRDTELSLDDTFPSLFTQTSNFAASAENNSIIRASENGNVILPHSVSFTDTTKEITYTPLTEFVHGDNVIGQITYTFAGRVVGLSNILYYNEDYPISAAEFEARWPSYLISPGLISLPSDTGEDKLTAGSEDDSLKEKLKSALYLYGTSALVGLAAAILVLLLFMYFGFIVPRRRSSRRRR